jgi:UDP-N-acetylmuramoylalanine--D-glutamate ligase
MTKDDYAVLELSSFQLFDLDNDDFAPDYSVITNITPNHLDWHTDMREYESAKKIIFKNQTESDRIVLSYDNDITRNIKCDASTVFFSKNILPEGVYCKNDSIYINENKIMDKSDIFIKGEHNVWNFMAAIAVTHDIAGYDAILSVAKNFKGVPHRIEFVRETGGVAYYNSTIDSSPTRTIAALNNFDYLGKDKKIIVILGGYDKKIAFDPLAPVVYKKAKAAVLYGQTKEKIKKCLDDHAGGGVPDVPIIKIADSFDEAVTAAKDLAVSGDIVLLSPACASFGDFKNFEERGNRFKELAEGF